MLSKYFEEEISILMLDSDLQSKNILLEERVYQHRKFINNVVEGWFNEDNRKEEWETLGKEVFSAQQVLEDDGSAGEYNNIDKNKLDERLYKAFTRINSKVEQVLEKNLKDADWAEEKNYKYYSAYLTKLLLENGS